MVHNYKHGMKNTRLYRSWINMKTRCYNINDSHFERWGGRGITICDEWKNDFMSFYDWAMSNGYGDNLTIDRIDNDKGYSPDNCRWTTPNKQSNNTRRNVFITLQDETKTVSEWSKVLNININTIKKRLKLGWNVNDAFYKPVRKKVK